MFLQNRDNFTAGNDFEIGICSNWSAVDIIPCLFWFCVAVTNPALFEAQMKDAGVPVDKYIKIFVCCRIPFTITT